MAFKSFVPVPSVQDLSNFGEGHITKPEQPLALREMLRPCFEFFLGTSS